MLSASQKKKMMLGGIEEKERSSWVVVDLLGGGNGLFLFHTEKVQAHDTVVHADDYCVCEQWAEDESDGVF